MQQTPVFPKTIDKHSETEMLLGWNTGDRYLLPFVELRFFCPCANCVDEHTGQRTLQRTSVSPDVKPTQVQLVGRYAIQITFSDGHSTGIYHYERLFELCQKQGRKLS